MHAGLRNIGRGDGDEDAGDSAKWGWIIWAKVRVKRGLFSAHVVQRRTEVLLCERATLRQRRRPLAG
jgi:hypothetical protein